MFYEVNKNHMCYGGDLQTFQFQAFVKDYLITFVRLLLGIDMAVGSGHLSAVSC